MSSSKEGVHVTRLPCPCSVALATLLSIAAGGCGTTAPARYQRFAEAGQAYVTAFDALADQSVRTAVLSDGHQLALARPSLSRDRKLEALTEHNDLLRARFELVGDLRRHAVLLGEYFNALTNLSTSDAPTMAGSAAAELGDSLSALGSRLKLRSLGEVSIAGFLQPVTAIVVGRMQRRALQGELEARGLLLARELALQEAALRALSAQLHHDLILEAQARERELVFRPFVVETALPAEWHERRFETLSASVAPPAVEAAVRASRRMQDAWRGLLNNRISKDDLEALTRELKLVGKALGALSTERRLNADSK
jgi:hypothetical protein